MSTLISPSDSPGVAQPPSDLDAGSPRFPRFDYLDGLRGWAALAVVFFHATWEAFGQALPSVRISILGPLNDGRLAVAVFFVLSGFVLSRRFVAMPDVSRLQRMAAGRYVRLALPIAAVSFIGYAMMSTGLLHNLDASRVIGSDWLAGALTRQPVSFLSFLNFAVYKVFTQLPQGAGYNAFTWTMPYELLGSFLVFGVLGLFGRPVAVRRLFLVLGFLVSYVSSDMYPLFFAGALLAELQVAGYLRGGLRADIVGLSMFLLAWFLACFFRDRFLVASGVMIVVSVLMSRHLQGFFANRVGAFLGRISFPLYLVHGYVLFGPGSWLVLALVERGTSMFLVVTAVAAMVIPMSLFLAWLLLPVERLSIRASHEAGALLVAPDRTLMFFHRLWLRPSCS